MAHWAPLESNPEVLNEFLKYLGVKDSVGFHDVYGLDDELLMMVPQPCLSLVFLFPTSALSTEKRLEIANKNVFNDQDQNKISPYFVKQTIRNACGAIAVIHSLSNNTNSISLEDGIFQKFLKSTQDLSSLEKGNFLEKTSEFANANSIISSQGQTTPVSADADIDLHFVSFVLNNGYLVELDGRLEHPIIHAKSDNLLSSAASVIKKYMSINPNEPNYSIIALSTQDF
ncbi:hypothetical protein BB561_001401 [Smittium simulii]|uniref:Ubiquitin carboxyl-terminal hydrolase n=1 Tax=Smittium simulii TaxID=133385 RepID=A0A2T9YUR4_9FUNG|nr:hypothetical protein BB561_001401 [Smittium simulii]